MAKQTSLLLRKTVRQNPIPEYPEPHQGEVSGEGGAAIFDETTCDPKEYAAAFLPGGEEPELDLFAEALPGVPGFPTIPEEEEEDIRIHGIRKSGRSS